MRDVADPPAPAWDFFIAHAGPDQALAEALFDRLAQNSRPFLASRCIRPGEAWDLALTNAQRRALITVVLVSTGTPEAYYQREEVAAAISLARDRGSPSHRVVPVYLSGTSATSEGVPYGLRLIHGLTLADPAELAPLTQALLALLQPELASARSAGDRTLSTDEAELVRHIYRYKGLCKIGALRGEYECLWMPSQIVDMQWGWERTAEEAAASGKAIGNRNERLRWIFVVHDLVDKGVLNALPKQGPRQKSTLYELTPLGWRLGLALQTDKARPGG